MGCASAGPSRRIWVIPSVSFRNCLPSSVGSRMNPSCTREVTVLDIGSAKEFDSPAGDGMLEFAHEHTHHAADIGDLYAWMSPDGLRLNLVGIEDGVSRDDREVSD